MVFAYLFIKMIEYRIANKLQSNHHKGKLCKLTTQII